MGGTLRRPSGIIRRRNERDAVEEKVGGQNLLGFAEFDKSNGTSGHVRCSRGVGAPSPPPELSIGGTKETRWTGKKDRKTRGALRSLPGSAGTSVRIPTFEAGKLCHPSRMFRRGSERDAVDDKSRRELAGPDGYSRKIRRVMAAFVFRRGRSVAPYGMICQGSRKRRGGRKVRKETS